MRVGRRAVLVYPMAAAAALSAGVRPVSGADAPYPARPVRVLVPFAAGGPTDLVARVLAEAMSQDLKQPVIVENRPGANGNVASEAVAKSDPDGLTLFYHSSHVAINPAIYTKLGFDPRKDLSPVSLVATLPLVFAVSPDLPVRSMTEFVAYAKARPGGLSFGSGGIGNVTHMAIALLLRREGLSAVHVPFRGTAPALAATAAGHVAFTVDAVNSAQSLVSGGQVRGLAIFGRERAPVLPDVPTMAESGLAPLEIGAWQGMMVAAGTPRSIVDRVNQSVRFALAQPFVRDRLGVQGATILGTSPEDYAAYLGSELERWAAVARDNGIRADG